MKKSRSFTAELKMIVLWMLLSLGPFAGRAQLNLSPHQLDTIFVSEAGTTVMIFPQPLSLVDLGSNHFQASTHEKVLLLKARPDSYGILPTTLFVRYGSEGYFQGFLAYAPKPQEPFFDWRAMEFFSPKKKEPDHPLGNAFQKEDKVSKAPGQKVEALGELDKAEITYFQARIDSLKKLGREQLSPRQKRDGLELNLQAVRNDSLYTYLRLGLVNHSSLPFRIKKLELSLREPVRGKSLQDIQGMIALAYKEEPLVLEPYGEEEIYLIFPHSPSRKKARLQVLLQERKGNRSLELAIPYTLILKAPILDE
ncbi:MAG: DUF4138 domain-containing protein [Bacteroidia bacterium]|nr:DUF4138 domain-containing protein [Bacteroidia bacterium]